MSGTGFVFASAVNDGDVLIVGAGASGLMAAYELSKGGHRVIVLEARPRIGGRIWTNHDAAFSKRVEMGAEFIHGEAKLTIELLKQFDLKYHETTGVIRQSQHGQWKKQSDFIDYARLLDKPLKDLKKDMSVDEFLDTLPDDEKHEELKYSVRKFVEGYDAADTSSASALAFRDEWLEGDSKQYRIDEGYGALMTALANSAKQHGCRIVLSSPLKKVEWKEDRVKATTANEEIITAQKSIITVPLGIFQLEADHPNAIEFVPSLRDKKSAAKELGYGSVIKILLEFKEAFWESKEVRQRTEEKLSHMGFLFTDTRVPTWWTQLPDETPLLTGWIGGPEAWRLKDSSNEDILQDAVNALAFVFQLTREEILAQLKAWQIANWGMDEYAQGAYSYITVGAKQNKRLLSEPLKDTLYFAGETYYSGKESATVEAALQSGYETARKISLLV